MKTLPKYFAIKRDANNPLWDKYIKWMNKKYDAGWGGGIKDYYGYNDGCICSDYLSYFGKAELITLEQWNECVNGEQRKIIGYKAPFDLYGGKVIKGALYNEKIDPYYYIGNDRCFKVPSEIVETWEAVYEEKLEIVDWDVYICEGEYMTDITFKGKLTQEIVDKIKEVINE